MYIWLLMKTTSVFIDYNSNTYDGISPPKLTRSDPAANIGNTRNHIRTAKATKTDYLDSKARG